MIEVGPLQSSEISAAPGAALGDGTALQDTVIGVVLHAGDEVDAVENQA